MSRRLYANVIGLLGATLAIVAIVVHVPGHLTMDSSMQLYEASTGDSISWFPPFMSALLRWLGGGTQAMGLFVALVSVLSYGAFAFACRISLAADSMLSIRMLPLRGLLVLPLLLSPVVFLYVGVVWKDVLFAALLMAAMATALRAAYAIGAARVSWSIAALLLLLPTPLVRQHGVFMAPWLALAPALCIAATLAMRKWTRLSAVIAVFAFFFVASLALRHLVDATIHDSGEKSTSVGFRAVESYDLTGMLAALPDGSIDVPELKDPAFLAAVRHSYTDDRIDFVMGDPVVAAGLAPIEDARMRALWLQAVRQHPATYAQVKFHQFGWLIGLHAADHCVPVQMGVDGNRELLAKMAIPVRFDTRDQRLYGLYYYTKAAPLYRHWFYIGLLAVLTVAAWVTRRRRARLSNGVLGICIASVWLLYGSFIPTGLACDFRYLYPALCMVSVLAIFQLSEPLRASPRQRAISS